jgi:hypothetical protein
MTQGAENGEERVPAKQHAAAADITNAARDGAIVDPGR